MARKQCCKLCSSDQAQYADFEPKFEWQANAASYVLRINLPGFKKEDFRVQVDWSGRLTVRGQRPVSDGKYSRFHKVFQLPDISNLDEICGRIEANVLSLTVRTKKPAHPRELPAPKEEEEKEAQKAILESSLEKAQRYLEEARAAAAKDREKKARNCKERVAWELQGLSEFKSADSLVEKINKNKEVIMAAAAAFSVGLFVCHKLCSRK